MKKQIYLPLAFLSTVFLIFTGDASAQVKKGDVLLGGSLNFYRSSNQPDNTGGTQTSLNLYPSFGKAIKDDLVLGLTGVYAQYHWKVNGVTDNSTKTDTYGGGVFIRRYKYLGSGFSAFMQGNLNGTFSKQESIYPAGSTSSNTKSWSINAGFEPGIAYAISKRVQVETGFQGLVFANFSHSKSYYYDVANPVTDSGFKGNAWSLGTNLSSALQNFIIGFRVLI